MNDVYLWMVVISAVLAIFVGLANFMSNGFFLAWIKAKTGRGKKVLIIMRSKLSYYPAFGHIEGNTFVWLDKETKNNSKNKIPKRAILPDPGKSPFFRLFNVWVTMIDEGNNSFISSRDYSEISGYDPISEESLIMRALMRPTFQENKNLMLILVLAGIVILILLGAVIFTKVNALAPLINGLRTINNIPLIPGVNV